LGESEIIAKWTRVDLLSGTVRAGKIANSKACFVLAHYQAIAIPCRIQAPDRRQGRVERWPLQGQHFDTPNKRRSTSIVEEHWAGTRIHGTTNAR
jgi:hypothetical protein